MIEVVRLKAEHIMWLKEKGGLGYLAQYVDWERLKLLENDEWAYSIISPQGGVLACTGIVEYWRNRGEVWAIFNPRCREQFLIVHRTIKRWLDKCPIKRLEATVDVDFAPGHRWIKLLGFKLEVACMRAYNIKGGDSSLYSRVLGE